MNNVLLGFRRTLVPVPAMIWQQMVKRSSASARRSLAFMSDDHHAVRDFVVLELPRAGEALKPRTIAENLDLPLPRVVAILDELEKHRTFLYRNEAGDVLWAYPITAEPTSHKIFFGGGEMVYGA